jgi:Uma2 family endonuclease
MTYEEFLSRFDGAHAEWVDGEVITMSPVSLLHDDLTVYLLSLLATFVRVKRLGRICHEPFQMKSSPTLPGRSPDILFASQKNLSRLRKTYLEGPADMVVEVMSAESRNRDRGEKFYEYEEAGVFEYWLLDPERKQAEFYRRDEAGIYQVVNLTEGVFRSQALPGAWLKVEWLWEGRPQDEVFRDWKLF